jgi:hypothetical protein
MPTVQRPFQFQIVTDTSKEAEQFMKEVEAFNTSAEETWYILADRDYIEYCCSFGVICYKSKRLKRMADFMDLRLVYVESYEGSEDCNCVDCIKKEKVQTELESAPYTN